jgi:Zn-dependent protease with chaperone function
MQKRGLAITTIVTAVATIVFAAVRYAMGNINLTETVTFFVAFWIIFYLIEMFISKRLG